MAENSRSESRVAHSGSVSIRDGLHEDRILGNLVPVDLCLLARAGPWPLVRNRRPTYVLEVLLLQDGKQKARHCVVCVGRHVDEMWVAENEVKSGSRAKGCKENKASPTGMNCRNRQTSSFISQAACMMCRAVGDLAETDGVRW